MPFLISLVFYMLVAGSDKARPICDQMRDGLVVIRSSCRFLGKKAKSSWGADSVELYGHHLGVCQIFLEENLVFDL